MRKGINSRAFCEIELRYIVGWHLVGILSRISNKILVTTKQSLNVNSAFGPIGITFDAAFTQTTYKCLV